MHASLFLILAAVSTAAINPLEALVKRQAIGQVPTTCQQTCTYPLTIYSSCIATPNPKLQLCTSACTSDNVASFVACFDCVLENTPGVSSKSYSDVSSLVKKFKDGCNQYLQGVKSSVTLAASVVPLASISTGTASPTGILVNIAGDVDNSSSSKPSRPTTQVTVPVTTPTPTPTKAVTTSVATSKSSSADVTIPRAAIAVALAIAGLVSLL